MTPVRTRCVKTLWIIALAVLSTAAASAQQLRLNRSEAPELGATSLVAVMITQLEAELDDLPGLPEISENDRHRSVRARTDYRVLARDLLIEARDDTTDGCHAMMMGMTMYFDREAIDAFLVDFLRKSQSDPNNTDPAVAQARAHLEAFSERARTNADDVRTVDINALDEAVPGILQPLADAWSVMNGVQLNSHWMNAPTSAAIPAPTTLDEINALLESDPLPEAIATRARTIASFLQRGRSLSELRAQVATGTAALHDALQLGTAIVDAEWLTDDERRALINRIDAALTSYTVASERDEALQAIAGFDPGRHVLEALFAAICCDAHLPSRLSAWP